MRNQRPADKELNPLTVLYQILCNSVFEDKYGANETAYKALQILGDMINKEAASAIQKKIVEKKGRYKYAD